VDSKDSHLSQLRLIWGSGLIKEEIMKELVKYWNREARLGRTLEEAARNHTDWCTSGFGKCVCGRKGNPELETLIKDER